MTEYISRGDFTSDIAFNRYKGSGTSPSGIRACKFSSGNE